MNYYLVDYENVKTQGLNGVNKLPKEDVVCIFYSENADNLTFGLHRRLNESKANIIFQKVEVGHKNALDFQLSSYLGYIIHENFDTPYDYYIVTKDKGYESLANYWKKRKVNVSLVVDVAKQSEQSAKNALEKQVAELIMDKSEAGNICNIIQQYKTKQGINNALMKKYPSKDNKKSSEIYTAIKPLLAEKKGK
ncbi:MAG: PIN domain-containing protein [Lachnospiraceae bacterium]|nr:PIN domain-containing protein [Lachnospiraceae bacterium]